MPDVDHCGGRGRWWQGILAFKPLMLWAPLPDPTSTSIPVIYSYAPPSPHLSYIPSGPAHLGLTFSPPLLSSQSLCLSLSLSLSQSLCLSLSLSLSLSNGRLLRTPLTQHCRLWSPAPSALAKLTHSDTAIGKHLIATLKQTCTKTHTNTDTHNMHACSRAYVILYVSCLWQRGHLRPLPCPQQITIGFGCRSTEYIDA